MTDAFESTTVLESAEDAIIAATVVLLNDAGVGAVSRETLCAATGLDASYFDTRFSTVAAVFAELVYRLTGSHSAHPTEITRRRSLTDLLTRTTMSFLEVLEQHPNEHQALMCLRVAEINKPGLVALRGPERTIHELLVANCRRWLDDVERVQEICWTLPTAELAVIQIGATDALVLDYLIRHDRAAAEHTIQISAYHLGSFGRRQFKNGVR